MRQRDHSSPPARRRILKTEPRAGAARLLIGDWRTVGAHPDIDGEVHGRASFAWHLGGAFLLMRGEIDDDERFPSGLMLFGSAFEGESLHAIYFDEREVARHMTVTVSDGEMTWQRDDPDFAQRLTIRREADGLLQSIGEMRKPGAD